MGLAFGETRELRVRYTDAQAAPLGAADVTFELVKDGSSTPAGAVISRGVATTDPDGVASVNVTGGGAETAFRVRASAKSAQDVEFFVAVADQGFAALRATPVHRGERPLEHFTVLEARLLGGDQAVACQGLDPAAPPASDFPPRTGAFGEEIVYPALPAGRPYTLFVWAAGAAGQALALGCVELSPAQVMAGGDLRLELPLDDLPVRLAARYQLESRLDLASLADVLLTTRDGWGAGACPLGPAQLVLDCALDALDAGDPADCVVASPGATATALAGRRGAPGPDGCRPATLAGGGDSLDAVLQPALVAQPPGASFQELTPRLDTMLADMRLFSELDTVGTVTTTTTHTLRDVSFADIAPGETLSAPLATPARPLLHAEPALTLGAGASPQLTVGLHGFTLRLGSLLGDTYDALEGVPGARANAGTRLLASLDGPGSTVGCAALSALVCPEAGLGAGCLTTACTTSLPVLDAALARPFTLPDGAAIDFRWSGGATALDAEHDLVAEELALGVWSATLVLSNGVLLPVTGTFSGTAADP